MTRALTPNIVSGGGIHFIRAFAEARDNIPPQQVIGSQVIGSMGKERFEVVEGVPQQMQESGFFVDDKAGNPIPIDRHV